MRKLALVGFALACMLAAVACRKQQKENPWVGTWKLDKTASKLSEVPQREEMQIDAARPKLPSRPFMTEFLVHASTPQPSCWG